MGNSNILLWETLIVFFIKIKKVVGKASKKTISYFVFELILFYYYISLWYAFTDYWIKVMLEDIFFQNYFSIKDSLKFLWCSSFPFLFVIFLKLHLDY